MRKDYEKMFIKIVLTVKPWKNKFSEYGTYTLIPRKMYDDANHYPVKKGRYIIHVR